MDDFIVQDSSDNYCDRSPFQQVEKSTTLPQFPDNKLSEIHENTTPHPLQHTYACDLPVSASKLQEVVLWMGHNSLNSSARYVQRRKMELQAEMEMGQISPAQHVCDQFVLFPPNGSFDYMGCLSGILGLAGDTRQGKDTALPTRMHQENGPKDAITGGYFY